MPASFSSLIFGALLAIALLVLPGFTLLRLCVPSRELGFISRLTLAPGITTALCVLMFAWGERFGLKFGPITPWLVMTAAALGLLVDRRRGTWRFANQISCRRLRRVPIGDWLAGVALVAALGVVLTVVYLSGLVFRPRRQFLRMGIDSIAAAIGEERGTLEDVIEPFLIQQGFVVRTARGRLVTRASYLHFGLKAPERIAGNLQLFEDGQ